MTPVAEEIMYSFQMCWKFFAILNRNSQKKFLLRKYHSSVIKIVSGVKGFFILL